MHPKTQSTVNVLVACMVILGVLLLPLPYAAYGILKFLLSLGLLCSAGFFLRPCKNLSFYPSADSTERGTRNPYDGSFSGTLLDSRTRESLADLTEENSEIAGYLKTSRFHDRKNSLPPISLQLSLAFVISAVAINPLTRIHLPRSGWVMVDLILLAILGFALHVIRHENAGERPHFPLNQTAGDPPGFPFLTLTGLFNHAKRLWPAILGGTFVLALLGTRVGESELEDFSLGTVLGQTFSALFIALMVSCLVYVLMDHSSNAGVQDSVKRAQVPGEVPITVFALVLICLTFGGYFTPKPAEDPSDRPDGYVPYDDRF